MATPNLVLARVWSKLWHFQDRNSKEEIFESALRIHVCPLIPYQLFQTNCSVHLAKQSDRPDVRELGDWSRKGPLPDLPGRGGSRVSGRGFASARSFGDAGSEAGGDRRERRDPFQQDDGKVRDFGTWERHGPLSPLPQQERQSSTREGGRSSTIDGARAEGFRDRRASPAAWGEGRAQGSQDGSRPPRREFQERPIVERAPTAAEQDNQWRTKMKPDVPVATSTIPSRDGSEGPASPAAASAPVGRPKLNLAKRTVPEAADLASPASAQADAKASPFGAARPIDTAAKEREIEEKRVAALKEKKEADDKAREEKRIAKEATKIEKTESETGSGAPTPDIAKKTENLSLDDASESKDTTTSESKAKETARPKPADTGAWRRPAAGPKPPRNDATRGPRGDAPTPPRGPRNDTQRGPRINGSAPSAPVAAVESEAAAPEEDGWSTVSKPKKNQRGGARA